MNESAEVRCLALASRQHGLIRRDQARANGLSAARLRTRLEAGRWQYLYPSVYRVAGSPGSWRQLLKGLCLWAGHGMAISHHSAAALLGFTRFREGPLELSVTRHLRAPAGAVLCQVGDLPARDLTSVDGLVVTSATRTLLDLSGELPEPALRAIVDEALRRRWTTLERLQVALERSTRRAGLLSLRHQVEDLCGGSGPTESELESLVRELLAAYGFTRVRRQQVIVIGGRLRRIDFRLEGTPIIIEADGYAYHSGKGDFERDRTRNNALLARGFVVLHWTWLAVRERPEALIAELRQALLSRGCFAGAASLQWSGEAPL